MGAIANSIRSTNAASGGTKTQNASTKRGSHNEKNYGGVASGQGIDWETTAQGRGYYDGVWRDSPLGYPATYGMILHAAANAGDTAGLEAADAGEGEAGNAGQEAIIQMMGPDVFNNAWHYQVNGYGSAAEYITMHCAYPSAVEQIIDDLDSIISEIESE